MMMKRLVFSLPAAVLAVVVFAGAASAAIPSPGWSIDAFSLPTSFSMSDNAQCIRTAGGSLSEQSLCDGYQVTVRNAGSRPTEGAVTVADTLPAGLTVVQVRFFWSGAGANRSDLSGFLCEPGAVPVRCHWPAALNPDETLEMYVYVKVQPGAAASLTNTAGVSGGGAGEASASVQNTNGSSPALFGVGAFGSLITGVDGAPDTQAGAHPYEFTTTFALNSVFRRNPENGNVVGVTSVQDVKDAMVDLPVGFAGSVLAAPMCTLAQLASFGHCPPDTRIGHVLKLPPGFGTAVDSPIWNIVPERGVAAEFGYVDSLNGSHVLYASVVPTPAGYVLRTTSPDVPQVALDNIVASIYGNPAVRNEGGNTPVAFFTDPADCSGEPLRGAIHVDSWQSPGGYNADGSPAFGEPNWASATAESPPVTGCDLLHFSGSISVQPESSVAAGPSGLNAELRIPQNENPEALATPPLRKAVVVFPAGVSVDPSAAGGLAVCSEAQAGISPAGVPNAAAPSCPEASKVGSVEVSTPAVAGVLQGSLYLAAQNENPFHTLLAGYIVVDDPVTGVLMKIPGRLDGDPVTGQLTATFAESPQFPFSDLKLHLFGGPRAPLVMPAACGTYTTSAVLTPWSAPDSGPPTQAQDSFKVDTGCTNGFAPGFAAGTTDNQAGAFSPFTATFSRGEAEQDIAGVSLTNPPGLLGILRGVERCPEPQASQGACGPNSLIGHASAAAGAGPDPFWVQGGRVFLTGPYKGAPLACLSWSPRSRDLSISVTSSSARRSTSIRIPRRSPSSATRCPRSSMGSRWMCGR